MNRWICGLHRGWAHSRKKGAAFLAAAALLLFFLEEPWVLWGSLLLGALDAYQLALEKRQGAPAILERVLVMLLTALFVSPHSYPLALPHAVFWVLFYILWGVHLLFFERRDLIQRGPSVLFSFFVTKSETPPGIADFYRAAAGFRKTAARFCCHSSII